MKELLDKISSYNIFNFLFPGVVFSAFASKLTSYNFLQEDVFTGVFVYYFIGAVISRIGSVLVEPALRKTKIVSFSTYEDFIHASKADSKLEVLSETNNMYRTICALLMSVAAIYLYDKAERYFAFSNSVTPVVCVVGLLTLFIFSYRKQTAYIKGRVSANRN